MNLIPVSGSMNSAVLGLSAGPAALGMGLVVVGLLVTTVVVPGIAACKTRPARPAAA